MEVFMQKYSMHMVNSIHFFANLIGIQMDAESPTAFVAWPTRLPRAFFPPRPVYFWAPLWAFSRRSHCDFGFQAFDTFATKSRPSTLYCPCLIIVCTPLLALGCNCRETGEAQHRGEDRQMQHLHVLHDSGVFGPSESSTHSRFSGLVGSTVTYRFRRL